MADILTFSEFLAQGAERWPDEPWCQTPDGEATRAEMYTDARRCVGGLRGLGVSPGDHVVIVLPNGLDFIRAWLGVVLTGAVSVAVNPKASSELAAVVEETGARLVVAPADTPVPASVTRVDVADICSSTQLKRRTIRGRVHRTDVNMSHLPHRTRAMSSTGTIGDAAVKRNTANSDVNTGGVRLIRQPKETDDAAESRCHIERVR